MTETKTSYNARYEKENCVQVKLKLVKATDSDIIAWLEAQDSKQGAIKRLIRQELSR